jgi:hypothetical protein
MWGILPAFIQFAADGRYIPNAGGEVKFHGEEVGFTRMVGEWRRDLWIILSAWASSGCGKTQFFCRATNRIDW